jgi:hypothetical protein
VTAVHHRREIAASAAIASAEKRIDSNTIKERAFMRVMLSEIEASLNLFDTRHNKRFLDFARNDRNLDD